VRDTAIKRPFKVGDAVPVRRKVQRASVQSNITRVGSKHSPVVDWSQVGLALRAARSARHKRSLDFFYLEVIVMVITSRVPGETRQKIQRIAEANGRTISATVAEILTAIKVEEATVERIELRPILILSVGENIKTSAQPASL
jgi:hypothetical protein